MFADDTNIFLSHKHIISLFSTMNNELKNIQSWFNSNKLSLTNKIKLNQLLRHQKHASRTIFFKRQTHTCKTFTTIYKCSKYLPVKYFSYLIVHVQKVKNEQTPQIFRTVFSVTKNKYNTQSCRRLTFSKAFYKTKSTQYNTLFFFNKNQENRPEAQCSYFWPNFSLNVLIKLFL